MKTTLLSLTLLIVSCLNSASAFAGSCVAPGRVMGESELCGRHNQKEMCEHPKDGEWCMWHEEDAAAKPVAGTCYALGRSADRVAGESEACAAFQSAEGCLNHDSFANCGWQAGERGLCLEGKKILLQGDDVLPCGRNITQNSCVNANNASCKWFAFNDKRNRLMRPNTQGFPLPSANVTGAEASRER